MGAQIELDGTGWRVRLLLEFASFRTQMRDGGQMLG